MANSKYIVGGKVYEESDERKVILQGKVLEETTATAPVGGAVINQMQQTNLGTDLFDGTIQ